MPATPSAAKPLFLAAIRLPPDAWSAFLDTQCGLDSDLRRRVERLLAAHRDAADQDGDAPPDPDETIGCPVTTSDEYEGDVVGPYRLLERVGEGGMGVVYVADQTTPVKRRVALKLIKSGMDSREVVARFAAERQALALMDHPNIARVFDGGTTPAGRPYFVMELVRGMPVTDYCDRVRLPAAERLRLFVQLCRAVQHAHQKGVIHRDLKPSNILVTVVDGEPVPKVIDFGVAKAVGGSLADKTVYTRLAQMVGTPLYMAPEQAELSGVDVDIRADVYSLGVVLYVLLTGTTPFDPTVFRAAGFDEMRRMIREDDPPLPSHRLSTLDADARSTVSDRRGVDDRKLGRLLRGDLDRVVMKALEKDRSRRYQSPAEFAADVDRYLADEPVEARPASAGYRLRKFARRNRVALVTAVVVMVAAVAGAGAVGWATHARSSDRAEAGRRAGEFLAEADGLERRGRWGEAHGFVERAAAVLGNTGGDPGLRDRVHERRRALALVLRLEEIRLEMAAVRDESFDHPLGDELFAVAFREFGADPDLLDLEEVARRLPNGPIRDELIAALDDWMRIRRAGPGDWERLLAAARAADPDPFRNEIRAAWAKDDSAGLQGLSRVADLGRLSPSATLLLVAHMDHRESIELLREAQQRRPDNFWITYELAESLLMSKPHRADEALGFYRAALALRPGNQAILNSLGIALQKLGRSAEAVAVFERAVALKPDFAAAHNNLGNILVAEGHLDKAVAEYRTALRLKPDYANAHSNLGDALRRKRQFAEASASLKEAIRLAPRSGQPYLNLGLVLADQGHLDEAIAAYREAIRLQPDYAKAHNNLGNAFQDKNQWGEAIAALTVAASLEPDDADFRYNLGDALRGGGQTNKAIVEYRAAIRLKPNQADVHFNLGSALEDEGRWVEAVTEFEVAARLDPRNPLPLNALAWVLAACPDPKLRNPTRAVQLARRAVQLIPKAEGSWNAGDFWNTLGIAHYRNGEWKDALAALETSTKLGKGGNSYDWFFLAMSYSRLGDNESARDWYGKAVRWMDQNKQGDADLVRFKAEAAKLLGILKPPPRLK